MPIAHAFGSWRAGLGVWAALAALAVLPVAARWRCGRRARRVARDARSPRAGRIRPARTRLGWAMAVYFGMQSLGRVRR